MMLEISLIYAQAFLCLAVATATLTIPPSSHGGDQNESLAETQILLDPFPFYVPPQDAMDSPSLFPMPDCHGVNLEEASIDDLQVALHSGQLSTSTLAECFLRRREQVDVYIK
jgi:amidase